MTSKPIFKNEMFEGFTERECDEHRTTGERAWCYGCTSWCHPEQPCLGCEAPMKDAELVRLRDDIAELRRALPVSNDDGSTTWPSIHDNPAGLQSALIGAHRDLEEMQVAFDHMATHMQVAFDHMATHSAERDLAYQEQAAVLKRLHEAAELALSMTPMSDSAEGLRMVLGTVYDATKPS